MTRRSCCAECGLKRTQDDDQVDIYRLGLQHKYGNINETLRFNLESSGIVAHDCTAVAEIEEPRR